MNDSAPLVFALNASRDFGQAVARQLGLKLAAHEEREFEDGEHKVRPLVNARNREVFVIHSLYADPEQTVNDKLCRLLFFIAALRDASASRITAVIPYLAYARKDKKSQTRDPVTTRYVAQLIETAGADRVVTLETHNLAAFQNAFRIPTDHLDSRLLFADHFAEMLKDRSKVTVVSPDLGGTKRADAFRETLQHRLQREVFSGFMEKTRALGVMTAGRIVGDLAGSTSIILDDLISTGGTIAKAARACKDSGALAVYVAATHGVFVGKAGDVLASDDIERIVVSNTIPPFRLPADLVAEKVTLLPAENLIAEAVRRISSGESIVELLEP